jgi:hypothetical protein
MRKRTLIPLLIAILLLCVLGVMLYLRAKAPPEAARLLPESDAIIFLNLKPVRAATHFDKTPLQRSPDFQHFIDVTGIVPERDLDSVALAFHRMPDPNGPNGPVAFSEVFVGRFDGVRLAQYLHSLASTEEPYAGRTIFTIPIDGRQLRIAQLGYDILAASNMPTTEQIHSMLDRSRAGALSTPGSSLLAARYHEVPILSEAWGIGHIGLPFSSDDNPDFISVLGLQLPLRTNTDFVASLRYTAAAHVLSGGAVHLRIEEFAPDSNSAVSTVDALTNLLNLLRGISADQATAQATDQQAPNPSNDAIQAILNTVTLTHDDSSVLLNANAGIDQLKALTTTHDPAASPLAPSSFSPTTSTPVPAPPVRPSSTRKPLHATRTAPSASN